MKKTACGLIVVILFVPLVSFAQSNSNSQPPATWVAFQKQQNEKSQVFFQGLKAEREAFLRAHPDVQLYLDQMRVNAQARWQAMRAAHQPKNAVNNTTLTTLTTGK